MTPLIWLAIWLWWLISLGRAIGFMLDRKAVNTNVTMDVYWRVRSRFIFAEYDQWIGCFIDRKNYVTYWFPIPFVGLKFSLERKAGRDGKG